MSGPCQKRAVEIEEHQRNGRPRPRKKLNWAALGAIALFIGFFFTLEWPPLVFLTLIAAYSLTIFSFTLKRRENVTSVIAVAMMLGMTYLLYFVFSYNRAVG